MIRNARLVTTLLLAAGALAVTATGCELIASIDRSLINGGGGAGGSGGAGSSTTGGGGAPATTGTGGTGGASASSSSSSGGTGGAGGASASSSGVGGSGGAGGSSSASSSSASSSSASSSSASSSSASSSSSAASSSSSGAMCANPCTVPADCPATGNECVTATCDASNCCGTTDLDQTHTLSTGQTAGDCQKIVCNGSGGTTSADDATDLPATAEICLANPACTGVPLAPSFTRATTGTNCSAEQPPGSKKHVCGDTTTVAAGTCVECNTAADCAATGNECVVATCTNHVCGTSNLDQTHTLSTGQTPGDCQKIVCNGAGGIAPADDATDLPVSNDICLINPACTGTPLAPSFAYATGGTDCSAEEPQGSAKHVCGDDALTGGTCVECNTNGDCTTGTCNNHVCQ